MKPDKVTEPEIVDALLGHSDPRVEEKIHRQVGRDLRTASLYAKWGRAIPRIQNDVREIRPGADHLVRRVMKELPETRRQMSFAQNQSIFEDKIGPFGKCIQLLGELFTGQRPIAATLGVVGTFALAVFGFWNISYYNASQTVCVEELTGQVTIREGGNIASRELRKGDRFSYPASIEATDSGHAVLAMGFRNRLAIRPKSSIYLENSLFARQKSGLAHYETYPLSAGSIAFTVLIPQGTITDLGTEFEVNIGGPQSQVRVDSGRVRLTSMLGAYTEARQGQLALMSSSKIVVDAIKAPLLTSNVATVVSLKTTQEPSRNSDVMISYRPQMRTLDPQSSLAGYIRPQTISLSKAPFPASLKKAPPFTSDDPLVGVIKMKIEGRPVEAVAAVDRKLDGKSRIFLDANLDGDLTNDPSFGEGEDFKLGTPFKAGLIGGSSAARQAIWLNRPIRIDLSAKPPKLTVQEDRLEVYNSAYMAAPIDIPASEKGDTASSSTPDNAALHEFLLLDNNSDGDYNSSGSALAVWWCAFPNVKPVVTAMGPVESSTTYNGYKWRIVRNKAGALELQGKALRSLMQNQLKVGDPLPTMTAQTIAGQPITLASPRGGFLLIYVWSSWFGALQRDIPYEFNGLYPKFKDRGLQMIGISVDSRKEDAMGYVKRNGVGYPQIYNGPDLTQGITAQLGIFTSPIAILVDPTGKVVKSGDSAEALWTFLDEKLPRK